MINDLSMHKVDVQKIKDTSESLREEIEYFKDGVEHLNNQIQIILKDMLEMRKKKEIMLQAESSILHLQSTIDKNSQLKEKINLELGRMNQELYEISQSEKIMADLTPKYQEYIQKKRDLVNVTDKALLYNTLLLDKITLESNINNERDMLNSSIQRLD